ncbi:MAG: tetratricopeptide repeat protein [Pseudomonadota bacterium]
MLWQQNKTPDAVAQLNAALRADAENATAYQTLGKIYVREGDLPQAAEAGALNFPEIPGQPAYPQPTPFNYQNIQPPPADMSADKPNNTVSKETYWLWFNFLYRYFYSKFEVS